ncbi:hypothetical protein AALO_G00094660 [Alosa alosa]|uniref:Ig-like domain-containing protein n=1 Tax=Alosa alosa TaxID=278164 RepID=A0AAV6GWM0_9TELE|nr:hypothetical protein AALO_G00094660 [Alosa alosa]
MEPYALLLYWLSMANEGKEKTLTFSKIRSEDSGEYLCRADNRIGQQDSPAVLIKVSYPHENVADRIGHQDSPAVSVQVLAPVCHSLLTAALVGVGVCGVLNLPCVIYLLRTCLRNKKTRRENTQDGNHGNNMQMNLNPNTTQPDAVYQSLNPNTMQPDPVYQTLNPYSHTN